MQDRDRLIKLIVLAIIVALGGAYGLQSLFTAYTERTEALYTAKEEHDKLKDTVLQGKAAKARIAKMRERSLPADPTVARTKYVAWLNKLATDSGLKNHSINPQEGVGRKDDYSTVTVRVDAEASLSQLARFLYEFYNVQQIQKLRLVDVKTIPKSSLLDVGITAEALLIDNAMRTDLNTEKSERFAGTEFAEFETAIANRNVFAHYKAPPPPVAEVKGPPPPTPFDNAKLAKVSGITADGEGWQVWLNVRTTGELMKLKEGEEFNVGSMKGIVKRIGAREVEIESEGKTLVVAVGQSLSEGVPQ